ncbi:zinc finger protein 646 isoform X1 [Elephas maximus indicus]|uniref:zinc finger protein 646 isoform X1 n=1 Tax=Elephas maximus indicus TaxID=99487 RepID=UPI002116043B|nr:zinc finger protein 646 isoform X1 [Elephas maximus indicus]XP_049760372.1 zinc finger protein 646 isoform X1 [Elephas maximus indicus]XP_049760374.1 zinc finger protein 646 isoform X1 [Elephas maximus indicus]XP_049760375.1 zinc finger protein 646 isoform X1 [Elephas maximus indicus]
MEDVPASFSCSDCQRHFPSLPELVRHRELLHPSPNRVTEDTDQIPRPYRCQQCGRGYRHPGSLVNHRRTHETGLFPCTTCGKDFTNPMALKSHMRTHAPEGRRRHRPPRPKEATPCFQGEMASTDSWSQKLGSEEGWENQAKHTEETPGCESGPDPRAARGTWEDPSTRQREGWESQPDPEERTKHWGATTNSARAPPLPTPASNLLSNLEQYLAESVVNFTGGQEPTQSSPAEEERRYKCSQCGKTYKHAGSLTNHRQSHTLGIYPCAICFKEFSNLMALKNHSRLHAQYRPYRCPHCPRAFRLPRELLEHQQSHEGERQEKPWEEKGMPTTNGHINESIRDQLATAQMLNGSGELSTPGELEDSSLEEYRPFRCEDCGRTYRHAGSLINHRKSHQTGVYPCSICSKQLFNAAALKNHVRAHHKPRQGTGEGRQSSVTPSSLTLSETTPKEEEDPTTALDHRPYKCNECGRAYRHRGSLVNHRHTHRTGEYQCSLCPRKYSNLMALRNHVRVHCKAARRSAGPGAEGPPSHLEVGAEAAPHVDQGHGCKHEEEAADTLPGTGGAPPQICSVCGLLFEDPESLDHHGRTHGGGEGENSQAETRVSPPRTFACQDCGKSYRHSGSLINHRQTHQTGDFSCGACAKHFHTMAAMKNHLRRHSRRRSRRHRRRAGSVGGGGGAKLPSAEDWAQELVEDSESPDFPQDSSGESPSGAEGNVESDGDCSQAEPEGDKCGLERDEACFQGDKEHRGDKEGPERKENCFLDSLDIPGDEEGSGARFCDGLTRVIEDQKPAADLPRSSPPSAEAVSSWQADASHTCSDCGHSFPHATGLLSHRPCHPPGIYQCSLCPKEFDSLPALRSHFRNHGPGEVSSAQPFLCCLCGMIFPGRAGYRLHRRQAHDSAGGTEGSEEEGEEEGATEAASTQSPPLQLSEAELLNQLQREVEALDGAGYGHICGCCGQTYDDLGSLERHHQSLGGAFGNTIDKAPSHLEESGNGTEMVTDGVCEGTVTSVSGEGADMKSGEGGGATVAENFCMQGGESSLEAQPRPFRCNQCGKTYRHGGSLVNHRKIHQTGDFICPVCSRCYPNLAAYRNHLRNHPRCKGSEPQVGPIPEAEGSCEPQITAEEGLGQAEVEKLQEELKVEPSEELAKVKEEAWVETTVKGEETELRLETAEKGCQTEASSERPFSCEVCGRSYKHAGSLINHRQSHQTGHFGCQACSKGFSNLMSLKNHRRIHADPRRFRCGECGKAFRLRKQLASHQRVHVERRGGGGSRKLTREDRPFPCGQCGRTYRHAGSLLNHRRSHETGQYSCPTCPKTYSNRMALKDHQRLHVESRRRRAGRSRRAAVRCALCGRGFPGRGSLERHLREHEEETKRELASGQGGPDGTGGSEGKLAGLAGRSCGNEAVPQLEDGAMRSGEHGQSTIRAAGSEARGPLSRGIMGKADGWQGDRGPVNHDGGWVPRGQVPTNPKDESWDSVPRSPCHLGNSKPSEPSMSHRNSWNDGDSSSQLQPESHPFSCCQCGKTYCRLGGLLNYHNTHKTDRHYCLLCSKEFLNPVATKSHSHNHIAAQTFACPDCGKAFQSHQELASHLQTHARGLSQVPLQMEEARDPKAGTTENQVGLLGQGKAQETPSEPSRAPGENAGRASRGQGVKSTGAEDEERPFRCAQCGRSYRHAGSLLNHQKAHTTGLYPCSLCPKLLPNLLSLKNHGRTHTDPKRHRCSICGKAFRTAARLEGHGRVHAPREGPFTCPHCPRHFRRQISFLQHQQQHQEEWTVAGSGAPAAPAAGRGDSSLPPPPTLTPLLDPSPQWPANLNFSL